MLFGFLSGICAGNYDVTDIFVDTTLKIIGDDIETLAAFVEKLSTMSTHTGTNVTLSVSLESDKLPESVKSIVKFA